MQRILRGLLCFATVSGSSLAFAQGEAPLPPLPAPEPAAPPPAVAPAAPSAPQTPDTAQPAPRAKYVPHGFTMELGLGLGYTAASSDDPQRERQSVGLAPLSLSLGGFVSPSVALMFRAAGSSYFREYRLTSFAKDDIYQVVTAFYGGAVQVWPSDRFFLGGGAGAAVYATNPFMTVPAGARFSDVGFGLTGRAGWAFAKVNDKHAFSLVAEGFPSFFGKTTVFASALNLEYQML